MRTSNGGGRLTRREGLVARDLGDEVMIVDPATNQAHCLSGVTAQVWRAAEGAAMPKGTAADRALSELVASGLLVRPGMSRRALLQRSGTAIALTGIASIALPEAMAHASGNI